jgi:adenosine kinase
VTRDLAAALAIVAPDGKEGMLQHARECAAAGVPFIFDPGQGLPMFSAAQLDEFIRLADYVAVNDYEGKMLEEKTGRKLETLGREVKGLVCTLGAQGSIIYAGGKRYEIPSVKAEKLADPTGCGDAYRAGLLYGIAHGWDWDSTGRLASVMGAIKIAHRGAQNHTTGRDEIAARFKSAFGRSPF